jgi:hypothetical protein
MFCENKANALEGICSIVRVLQSPNKNENVLKSVTIDGTVCKRVNRCDRVVCRILSHRITKDLGLLKPVKLLRQNMVKPFGTKILPNFIKLRKLNPCNGVRLSVGFTYKMMGRWGTRETNHSKLPIPNSQLLTPNSYD